MNKKNLFAILVGFVVSFLLGWLVYGMLLKDTMATSMMPGLAKPETEMNWLALIIATLCWVTLLTLLLGKMGVNSFQGGLMTTLWISFLIALYFDLLFWATSNMFTSVQAVCIDIAAATITNAITGGAIGWMLGMKPKAATATA